MILDGKRILITGGTGSMGKTLVKRLLTGELGTPKKIIVLSRDEAKQHYMRVSYLNKGAATDEVIYRNFLNLLEFRIGDVRNYNDIVSVLRDVDIVINAAALKQVPTCEYFPWQAIQTNCQAAANIAQAIREFKLPIETVVGVSTDKACKPVNAMGMTKALQERIFISANVLNPETRFICVRYGNVLASRGSVIPLFHDQIKKGGPVTITMPEMTRFLLSLNQAVDTVFAALRWAKPGEIYIPRAPSATVENIAKVLIGDKPIHLKYTGIRPGEKIHEILISEEESHHCVDRGDYYAIIPMLPELNQTDRSEFIKQHGEFSSAGPVLDIEGTRKLLEKHSLLLNQVDFTHDEELLR